VVWAETAMSTGVVNATAENPLGEASKWWSKADCPLQTIAICIELSSACSCPDPTQYMTNVPVHQDGSCNGLQHYAALGRDSLGGAQVNLTPSTRPQDVYSGVCDLVRLKIDKAACQDDVHHQDIQEKDYNQSSNEKDMAIKLQGVVDRKVVKQTVMTSVYGVTFIGAKEQIMGRLKEKQQFAETDPLEISRLAHYVTKLTFESLGEVFSGATQSMDWLSRCAQTITKSGNPVRWTTPLGLPVVQPYRRIRQRRVRTTLAELSIGSEACDDPVHKERQRMGFPPNYVHSLDSTHLLMTALACQEAGIEFAAVHDSYWTHPGKIETLNTILRETFIELHEPELLQELYDSFVSKYTSDMRGEDDDRRTKFDLPPARGDLDLKQVVHSEYFFS